MALKVLLEFVKSLGSTFEKNLLEISSLISVQFHENALENYSEGTLVSGFELLNLLVTSAKENFIELLKKKKDFRSILRKFLEFMAQYYFLYFR